MTTQAEHHAEPNGTDAHRDAASVSINNPLRGPTTLDNLDAQVRRFHDHNGLANTVEVETLVRGGRVAREPRRSRRSGVYGFRHIPNLTTVEEYVLNEEQDRSFTSQIRRLPRDFRVILATCCLAAIVQGWNQSNLNGANIRWPTEFFSKEAHNSTIILNLIDMPPSQSGYIWQFGVVNAISYFSAAALGCWLSDPLNEYIGGRRGALFIAALFSFAGCIASAYTKTWKELLVTRIITGIGMGAKASVAPIFIAETAPTAIRGTLLTSWQALDAFGIMCGFAANLVVLDSWRKQMAAAFIPAVPLLILVPLCPESPRWLLKKGRIAEAYKSMLRLRGSPILASRDLLLMHAQLQAETKYFRRSASGVEANSVDMSRRSDNILGGDYQDEVERTRPWTRFAQLFRDERMRNASICAFLVMISQILCGVNIIFFTGTTIFSDIGGVTRKLAADPTNTSLQQQVDKNNLRALWMAFGIGMANFLFVAPAWRTIDRKGRRWLLNRSFPFMALTLLLVGVAGFRSSNADARIPVVVVFLYLFVLAYSFGEGPIAFTLSAEVFPLVNREIGMSFAVFWNMLGNGVLALVVPWLAYTMHYQGLFCLFAVLNVLLWVLNFFITRETAEFMLEELNWTFEGPTWKHCRYQYDKARHDYRLGRRDDAQRPPRAPTFWMSQRTDTQLMDG